MPKFTISSTGSKLRGFAGGYIDLPKHGGVNNLCPPSQNVQIDKSGVASTRPGYIATGWDLATANKFATSFYMKEYNITFFASDTKVKYVEHDRSDTVVDTGIALTTATKSRFTEYNGVVYVTNQTDGAYGILVTRLNGAVASSDSLIETDVSGTAMANVFDTKLSLSTNNLRIQGTNENYDTTTVSGGVFDLTTSATASQAYDDNAIAIIVYDLTAIIPKASKIIPWKESLNAIGVDVNNENQLGDRSQSTLYFSKFATAATAEASVTWNGGTAGSELVGKSGIITNALATRDYLYLFNQSSTHWIAVSTVNASTGARPPQILSSKYGCLNEDCAADLGDGTIAFITNNKRIIAIRIETDNGAAVVFPDDTFDTAISETLKDMDTDQSDSHTFYSESQRRLFVQVKISGAWTTLVYDNEIKRWLPPWKNYVFKSYFEKDGTLFATALNDDTIYEIGTAMNDDGIDIQTIAATTRFENEDGRTTTEWSEFEISAELTNSTEITVTSPVDGQAGSNKTIDATGLSFSTGDPAIGFGGMGGEVIGGGVQATSLFASTDRRFAIYPTYGGDVQIQLECVGDGQAFKFASYTLRARTLDQSILQLS